ncbi:MAG: pyruvate ferredoxin oxidoreductase [Infirmifilum sp.]
MSTLLLTGNYAAAYAVRDAEPDVISAYPITPQTPVIEKIAEFIDSGELSARFVRVESEHSAMAALIGAAGVGARTYTATSSQGLFYMYEVLWWAAGARLPIVMGIVMRALGPPWSIWTEHSDFYALRDSGWNLFMASSAQEVYDLSLVAFKVAEDPEVLLPTAVGWDAFEVSHTYEPVSMLSKDQVRRVLPPKGSWKAPLAADDPASLGNLAYPEEYIRIRYEMKRASDRARSVIKKVLDEYSKISGRNYSFFECKYCEDADTVFVVQGSIYGETLKAVEKLRGSGEKVGVLKLWLYRPFPYIEVSKALEGAKRVVALPRASTFGGVSAIGADLSFTVNLNQGRQQVFDVSVGVGGVDVTARDVEAIYKSILTGSERVFWRVV